jgi:short subunit dehydrogenase-like uncharacterized protein
VSERRFDLVLFGATSFAGRLTARYLRGAAPAGARIALAGRSAGRLERLRASLGAEDWPALLADTTDQASLDELAAGTRVLATTVGPYRRYGISVVAACAGAGTHYADLTGEVVFMRESIDRFDVIARESGARIVHSCGFDSIPSDLGVLLLHEAAKADDAGELEETTLVVRSFRGGFSGGTLDTMKVMLEDRRDPELARLMDDPYALSPDRSAEPDLGSEKDLMGVQRDEGVGCWVGPFVMAQVNTRAVRRSNALRGWDYGRRFRYREVTGFGSGPLAPVLAGGTAAGLGALLAGMQFGPVAALLDRVLPAPGEGPSERARERGRFRIEIHARTSGGRRYVCHIAAEGDPGYKATSVMFGESALALAFDAPRLPPRAGVLTPATALADTLAERLRGAGHTYEVHTAPS